MTNDPTALESYNSPAAVLGPHRRAPDLRAEAGRATDDRAAS
jgi:hypothetical protein